MGWEELLDLLGGGRSASPPAAEYSTGKLMPPGTPSLFGGSEQSLCGRAPGLGMAPQSGQMGLGAPAELDLPSQYQGQQKGPGWVGRAPGPMAGLGGAGDVRQEPNLAGLNFLVNLLSQGRTQPPVPEARSLAGDPGMDGGSLLRLLSQMAGRG